MTVILDSVEMTVFVLLSCDCSNFGILICLLYIFFEENFNCRCTRSGKSCLIFFGLSLHSVNVFSHSVIHSFHESQTIVCFS